MKVAFRRSGAPARRTATPKIAPVVLPILLAMGCAEGGSGDQASSSSSSSSGVGGEAHASSSGSGGHGGAGGHGGGGAGGQGGQSSAQGGAGGQGGQGGAGGDGGAGGAAFVPPVGTPDYPAETEQNNIKASADALAAGTKGFTSSLYPIGDVDVYAVDVAAAGSSLKVKISDGMGGCPPNTDVTVRVLGPSGVLATKSGACPSLSPPQQVKLGALTAGAHYVQIECTSISVVPLYVVDIEVLSAGCGDGTVQAATGEQCDDGNVVSGDGCSDVCVIETTCGDAKAFVAAGEQCDDGNVVSGDGCSDTCTIEGKAYTTEAEPNDASSPNTLDGFDGAVGAIQPIGDQDFYSFTVTVPDSSVRIETTNGKGGCPAGLDSVVYLYDAADVELAKDDDDGAGTCSMILPTTDVGAKNLPVGTYTIKVEDLGNNSLAPFYVLDVKVSAPGCGDLLLSAGEQCDDGNTTSGDGCSDVCLIEVACGDGAVHAFAGEQCDDGNVGGGDGCSATCQIEGKLLVNESEPNDPAAMSPDTLVGFDGAVGALGAVGDQDVYTFDVTTPGSTVVVKVTDGFGGCPGFDSTIYLYDPNGAQIATDDNDGPGNCSLIQPATDAGAANLAVGSYTVMVEETGNNLEQAYYVLEVKVTPPGCGDALLQAGEECDDGNTTGGDGCDAACMFELNLLTEIEPNGAGDPPNSLVGYEGAKGSIGALGDVDRYSFDVTVPGSSVTLEVTDGFAACPLGFDSELTLYSPQAAQIAYDNNGGADLCSLISPALAAGAKNLPAGTYTVAVNELGNNKLQPFYVLEVSVKPPGCGDGLLSIGEECDDSNNNAGDGCDPICLAEPPWEAEPNNDLMTANVPWAGLDVWRGAIKPVGDVDYYAFNFPGGGATLALETRDVVNPANCGFDTYIHLLDINGVEIAKDDDDGAGNCSKLSSALDPALANLPLGTYFVWVQRFGNSAEIAAYELALTIQ